MPGVEPGTHRTPELRATYFYLSQLQLQIYLNFILYTKNLTLLTVFNKIVYFILSIIK